MTQEVRCKELLIHSWMTGIAGFVEGGQGDEMLP